MRSPAILDADGTIARLVNNYSRISFNFGPTLLAWMEANAPDVYQRILDADRESQASFQRPRLGHGPGLQPHHHAPGQPTTTTRTQVVWGLRDFRHRFGRDPEGMWLAETAVDIAIARGPGRARHPVHHPRPQPGRPGPPDRRRATGATSAAAASTPRVAYVQKLPSGRTIALFFYDGPISQAVAFEKLLTRGEDLADRLMAAFSDERRVAAARPHRHRRRVLRPPPRPRRHGPRLRARPHRRHARRRRSPTTASSSTESPPE